MSTLINVNSTSPTPASGKHQPNPVAPTTAKTILTVEEIQKLAPALSFALVDRIIDMCQGSEPLELKTSRSMSPISRAFSRATDHAWGADCGSDGTSRWRLTQMPEAEGRLFYLLGLIKSGFAVKIPGDQLVMTTELLWIGVVSVRCRLVLK